MTGLIDSISTYLWMKAWPERESGGSNEPSAGVRSKVEAHLLRPDNRKTNEARKASLETPRCCLGGRWNPALVRVSSLKPGAKTVGSPEPTN